MHLRSGTGGKGVADSHPRQHCLGEFYKTEACLDQGHLEYRAREQARSLLNLPGIDQPKEAPAGDLQPATGKGCALDWGVMGGQWHSQKERALAQASAPHRRVTLPMLYISQLLSLKNRNTKVTFKKETFLCPYIPIVRCNVTFSFLSV